MARRSGEGDMTTELIQARAMLAEAIGAEPAGVPEDARLGVFERWDSLAHMRLILALEQRIGRLLDPDEAVAIDSLDDVARLLNSGVRAG
jgi:acyl carrier protein